MSKKQENVQTVEFEEVNDLQKEVDEAKADVKKKAEKPVKTKEPFINRVGKHGKTALKVAIGIVAGFTTAVFAGVILNKHDKHYDEYLLETYGTDETVTENSEETSEEGFPE